MMHLSCGPFRLWLTVLPLQPWDSPEHLYLQLFYFILFYFLHFMAAPAAYGGSQAKG